MKDSGVVVIHIPNEIDSRPLPKDGEEITGLNYRMYKIVYHDFIYQLVDRDDGKGLQLELIGWTDKRCKSWSDWWKTVRESRRKERERKSARHTQKRYGSGGRPQVRHR